MVGASLPMVACSSSDAVEDTCNSVCGVPDTNPCFSQKDSCIAECRALGVSAKDRGFKPDDCAKCLLGLIEASGWQCKSDSERCTFGGSQQMCEAFSDCNNSGGATCFGFNTKAIDFMDPQCLSVCFQPDAGMPTARGF